MKKNILVTDQMRKEYEAQMGEKFPEWRHSGRSLGRALMTIGKAMNKPGKTVYIQDHYGPTKLKSICADEQVARIIRDVVGRLNLQGFRIRHEGDNLALYYEIFQE